jgi:hypothetical protein
MHGASLGQDPRAWWHPRVSFATSQTLKPRNDVTCRRYLARRAVAVGQVHGPVEIRQPAHRSDRSFTEFTIPAPARIQASAEARDQPGRPCSHRLPHEVRSIIADQGRIPHATHQRKVHVAPPLAREAASKRSKRTKGGLKEAVGTGEPPVGTTPRTVAQQREFVASGKDHGYAGLGRGEDHTNLHVENR